MVSMRNTRWLADLGLAVAMGSMLAAAVAVSTAVAAPVWPSLAATGTIAGFVQPTNIVSPGDGTDRLFVTDRAGVIRLVKGGSLVATPALDIHDVVGTAGEQGLLGLAFPPGFAGKQYAYIYFTNRAGSSYFYRVRISASDPDVFDRTTMQLILKVAHPHTTHYGGAMAFGPDGYLYIGIGDGGSAGDPQNQSQNLGVLLGKIMRLDVESTPSSPGYRIPAGNPFVGRRGARPEIWAYGLRNPWRFSFDPSTGDLWIGDVGQDRWEEVDRMTAGARGWNFGWSLYEGSHFFKAKSKLRGFAWPVAQYSHAEGEAVMGGYRYRGSSYPRMQGVYFFGDYASGSIWGLQDSGGVWVRQLLLATPYAITAFGVDDNGELWVTDLSAGTIHHLVDTGL